MIPSTNSTVETMDLAGHVSGCKPDSQGCGISKGSIESFRRRLDPFRVSRAGCFVRICHGRILSPSRPEVGFQSDPLPDFATTRLEGKAAFQRRLYLQLSGKVYQIGSVLPRHVPAGAHD